MSQKPKSLIRGSPSNPPPDSAIKRALIVFTIGFSLTAVGFWAYLSSTERPTIVELATNDLTNQPGAQIANFAAPTTPAPIHAPPSASASPPPQTSGSSELDITASTADNLVQLLAEGNNLLQAGKTAEAVAKYEQALKHHPEDEDIHFNLGIALAKLGKREEAKKHYEEALRLFPGYSEVHNNYGNLLMAENYFAGAVEHFKAALQSSPDSASAHNNLGTAYARQGKIPESVLEFSEAVRLQPDYAEAHYNLGNAYLSQSRKAEAVGEFKAALKARPDFQPATKALMRIGK